MEITIHNKLLLENIPPVLHKELIDTLTIPNPKWIENHRLGRWNRGTPRHLKYYEKARGGRLFLPRGYIRHLISMCKRYGIPYAIADCRRSQVEVNFEFMGKLKPFQKNAAHIMLKKEFGTLSAATGSGKTIIALYMIAKRRQPALIVVHTKELAFQWVERIINFLGIPEKEVGLIGAGKHQIGKKVTVSLVQSLYKCAEEVSQGIGHLIVDECHRTPSRTFTDAVSEFDSRFMLGLSATPWRRDKLSKLIFWHLGDVQHEVNKNDLITRGDVLSAEVILKYTEFKPFYDPINEYPKMLAELVADDKRNRMIAEDVANEANQSAGVCLVLSDRKGHCETLRALLRFRHKISSELLTGDLTGEQRRQVVKKLNEGQVKVLIATGQLIGEGFDCRDLAILFLATPIKFDGRLLQYLGRVLRTAPGKTRAKVYDYVDINVGPLKAAAKARQKVYKK